MKIALKGFQSRVHSMKRQFRYLSAIMIVIMLFFEIAIPAYATQSKSENFSSSYTLTGDPATDIARVAMAQNGQSQDSLGYTEGWCADFVSDCAEIIGQSEAIPFYGGVKGLYDRIIDAGGYEVSTPKIGDIVFYNWSHVGIMSSSTECVSGNMWTDGYSKVENWNYTSFNAGSTIRIVRPNYKGSYVPPSLPRVEVLSGVYVIHSAWDDNMCLDIYGDSMESDANIQLYERVYNNVQKFRINRWNDNYYCIQSVHSGMWLDVKTPIGDNSNVKLYENNFADENDWFFEDAGDGYVYIKNRTGYYLDVQFDRAVNNANIQLYHFVGNNSQKWRLEEVTDYYSLPDGVYKIHSGIDDNYVFDIFRNQTENHANIQLYEVEDSTVQQFEFINEGGYYVVKSVYADKWLDIKTPIGNGSNVQLWESRNSAEEHWVLEDAGNGYVYIRSNADYYLDVQGDEAKNNANIQVYHFMGNNSQKWKLVPVATITVSYDANGGSNAPESQVKIPGKPLTLTDSRPSRSGWYFLGWSESPYAIDPDYPCPGGTFTRDTDTVLYAVWAKPDFILPAAITEIDAEAFVSNGFRFAELPKHTVSIGERAFAECPNLKYIYIDDDITDIADNAFENVKGLTIFGVALSGGRKSVAETFAEEHGFTFVPVLYQLVVQKSGN